MWIDEFYRTTSIYSLKISYAVSAESRGCECGVVKWMKGGVAGKL